MNNKPVKLIFDSYNGNKFQARKYDGTNDEALMVEYQNRREDILNSYYISKQKEKELIKLNVEFLKVLKKDFEEFMTEEHPEEFL